MATSPKPRPLLGGAHRGGEGFNAVAARPRPLHSATVRLRVRRWRRRQPCCVCARQCTCAHGIRPRATCCSALTRSRDLPQRNGRQWRQTFCARASTLRSTSMCHVNGRTRSSTALRDDSSCSYEHVTTAPIHTICGVSTRSLARVITAGNVSLWCVMYVVECSSVLVRGRLIHGRETRSGVCFSVERY
jgi:hypothetical protein